MLFPVGSYAYLTKDIFDRACEDHPEFWLGNKGDRVKIIEHYPDAYYQYRVEGPANPGKYFGAKSCDLMFSKPMF